MSAKSRIDSSLLNPTLGAAVSVPINKSQEEFDSLAQQAISNGCTHVPVVREMLADLDTPVSTYMKLANQPYSYLFESVQGGSKWGRYSIIGLPCTTVFRFHENSFSIEKNGVLEDQYHVDDPLQKVRELTAQYRVFEYPGLPEMIGGLVGYFGYETIAHIEPKLKSSIFPAKNGELATSKPDEIGTPDIMLLLSTQVVVFDNLSGRIFIVTLANLNREACFEQAREELKEIERKLLTAAPQGQSSARTSVDPATADSSYYSHFPQHQFEQSVEKCREYIREGDIMQVVLSQRLSTEYHGEPLDLYRALRTINPSPYMYYLDMGGFEIVGSSPEILVRLEGKKVTVRPIAGTRKRGANDELDLALEQELLNDEKEIAEHVMLIDLGRNDVGRIAATGSVKLTERMAIERYSHVMHIVSNVDGDLRQGMDAIDVLRATFPAGTVSGAPKIRAMQVIDELEPCKRGIYSGAIGYLGWNGNMDTAISIRTAIIKDQVLYIQAGAGVVADSVAEYEYKETLSKARVMFKASAMASGSLGLNINDSNTNPVGQTFGVGESKDKGKV